MSKKVITALVLFFIAGPLLADTPFDVTNPVPRGILVQLDEDFTDYSLIGSAFGAPVQGTWLSNGTYGLITLPGTAVEDLVAAVFTGVTVVPGSFSNYEILIDLATLEIIFANISGQIDVPLLGVQAFSQTASSIGIAGFELMTFLGIEYPAFCTSGAGCTIVPGAPYDPITGQLNAVGNIATIFNVFTPFGDLRLTEIPADPFCSLQINQPVYVDGEFTGLSTLRYANFGSLAAEVRVLLELQMAGAVVETLIDVGAGGGFFLPGGLDVELGPVFLLPVPAFAPRGNYAYRCALEDPLTGTVLAEDFTPFEIQ